MSDPWFVSGVDSGAAAKRLTIQIDFTAGSCIPIPRWRAGVPCMTPLSSDTGT
jgi:hypothetical protein